MKITLQAPCQRYSTKWLKASKIAQTIKKIAKAKEALPAHILITWALHRTIAVIPKSTKSKCLQENFESETIAFGKADMKALADLEQAERIIDGLCLNNLV